MRRLGALVAAGLTAGFMTAVPAQASPDGEGLVISEAYLNGGSAGASFLNKFVEIHNPGDETIDVAGWSVQYRSYSSTGAFTGVIPLGDHHVAPGDTLLVSGGSNAANGAPLPTPDVTSNISFSGNANGGTLALASSTTALTGDRAAVLGNAALVDLVGYGASSTYEGSGPAPSGYSVTSALVRTADADTDNNAADLTGATPTPTACGEDCDGSGAPVDPPVDKTIAEIQGDGPTSPLAGKQVTTTGVVTAVYKTGGFSGAYLQTDGTGGDLDLTTHTASDGVFVFSSAFAAGVDKGDKVSVTGGVSEFNGLTEISTSAGGWTVLDEPVEGVEPASVAFPLSVVERESLEGMLLKPTNDFTVTNNYTTNQYAEIGLADGDEPLPTPTNVVAPGAPAIALQAENDARLVTLDDGSSLNFLSAANQGIPLPWLTADNEVRVGAPATFEDPVVLDYRNNAWKLQPTEQLTAGGDEPVSFGSTRVAKPKDVGGDVKIGAFNVLNYFSTTAEDYVASGGTCSTYKDRVGNPITANTCSGNGPRGAADAANLERQQAKIVSAMNTLDASVVSLEEIENSRSVGLDNRDEALATLVGALNEAAGSTKWAFVPSPAEVPADEDVIRTAFIYQPKAVETVGESKILIGSAAFDNAREPLAQAFKPVGGSAESTFAVVVNHFKSKGSGSTPEDEDQGDGQGASNHSRKLQAAALVEFADAFKASAGTESVFLTGDFNAYNEEDPVSIIEAAGYVNVPRELTDKETYQFDGQIGSLDHVFASDHAFTKVTGADIWNINAYESLAREYSRFNYNVTDFYKADPFRASDHDPEIIGFTAEEPDPVASTVKASIRTSAYGAKPEVSVQVAAGDVVPTGTVTVTEKGSSEVLGTAELSEGKATVALKAGALKPGRHQLTVSYDGDPRVTASSVKVTAIVTLGKSTTKVTSFKPGSSPTLGVAVSGGELKVDDGLVLVFDGFRPVGVAAVKDGQASVRLIGLKGSSRTLTLLYSGGRLFAPSTTNYRTP